MKQIFQSAFCVTIGVLVFSCGYFILQSDNKQLANKSDKPLTAYCYHNTTEWLKIIDALIQVESGGNDKAVNKKSGASGCLQLMPVYVKAVNQIIVKQNLKDSLFTLNDRFDRDKSIRMFNILQGYYNPEKDFLKALHYHNPGASVFYRNKILKTMLWQ